MIRLFGVALAITLFYIFIVRGAWPILKEQGYDAGSLVQWIKRKLQR